MNPFDGQRVVVAGLGTSGVAAARVLMAQGATVRAIDDATSPAIEKRADELRRAGAAVETGGHDAAALAADLAVLSPGIPPGAAIVSDLIHLGIPLISEIELAHRLSSCEFLAVTGTNGKTTTTSLLADMLAAAGIASLAAGNIGLPLVEAIAQVPAGAAIAVEVSSFQLAYIDTFRAHVAVVLNIAEDHTDWHGSIASYAAAKARIVENQSARDHLVANAIDGRVMAIALSAPSIVTTFSVDPLVAADAHFDGTFLTWEGDRVVALAELKIAGRPALEDALAALAAAARYGIDREPILDALRAFEPLHHRFERVAEIGGVTYIDDSKATNPHATLAAVAGLEDVVLIAGGRSKGIDLAALARSVPPVIAVIALGEAADEVAAVFDGLVPVEAASDMSDAVRRASRRAVFGGSVLLSPGCASLDMYRSYAERGEHFVRAVRALERGDGDGDA